MGSGVFNGTSGKGELVNVIVPENVPDAKGNVVTAPGTVLVVLVPVH